MDKTTKTFLDKKFGGIDKKFKEQQDYIDKHLNQQSAELKAHAVELQEELAHMTNKGFEDVIKRLDVRETVERHERVLQKVVEALNIRV